MIISNNIDTRIKPNLFCWYYKYDSHISFWKKKERFLFNKFKFDSDIVDNINNEFCEMWRPKGDYELIFPTNKPIDIYKRYILCNI